MTRTRLSAIIALSLCMMWTTNAAAQVIDNGTFLTPNGNPTGTSSITTAVQPDGIRYTVSLNPVAAAYDSTDVLSLMFALANIGICADNGWTINRFDLQGSLTLGTYLAWANIVPAYSQGMLIGPAADFTGYGGAQLTLGFRANAS